jgi:hypothetical protein
MNQNNSNPYSNNHNPYSSNNDFDRQRQQREQQIKQNYKIQAEQGMDGIVHSYLSAKRNDSHFNIDEVQKSAVNRYYNRYWSNDFVLISMLIMLISFVASFYSNVSIFGILVVLIVFNSYSQTSYIKYFGNDIKINADEEETIKNLIFPNQLNSKTIGFLSVGMTLISYLVSLFSRPIYLDENDSSIVIKALHYFKINFENELFAYSVAISILILIFLKIYEKWSR